MKNLNNSYKLIFSKINFSKLKEGGIMSSIKIYKKFILRGWNDTGWNDSVQYGNNLN